MSLHGAIDLLKVAMVATSHENEILTTAGAVVDLATWAYVWAHECDGGCTAAGFLDWLHAEARRYEASIDEDSAADYAGPDYYAWLNEQGREIRAKVEEGH